MNINDLTFGVEIECMVDGIDYEGIAGGLMGAGIEAAVQSYNHNASNAWKVTSDASLNSLSGGVEIVSPILKGADGFEQVRKVCKVLKTLNATVDQKCGFHVHVGVRDQKIDFFKNIFKLYANFENVIDGFMAPSRRQRSNNFCKSMTNLKFQKIDECNDMSEFEGLVGGDRYMKLNVLSYWRHGTVEFRHHGGTINSSKMISWVMVCLNMVKKAADTTEIFQKTSTTRIVNEAPQRPRLVRRYSNTQRIIDILFREEGVTADEVNDALGFPRGTNTWGSIGNIARNYNIPVRSVHVGNHVKRFFVNNISRNVTEFTYTPIEKTFEKFVEFIDLSPLETSFLQDRTEEFANVQ